MKSAYDRALLIAQRAKPDLRLAKSILEGAATAGDHRATYALATWYLHGKPPAVDQNVRRSAELLKVAAESGHPQASFDYAVSLEKGVGVKKNEKLALRYYLRSALSGDLDAIGAVGRMYYYGLGVAQDRKVAWIWLDQHRSLAQAPQVRSKK